ncbi:MAG: MFS transporter [Burkholderiaceae bacterium]
MPDASASTSAPLLRTLPFQIGLLTVMQAMLLMNNVSLIAVSGLAGLTLASDALMATLPVTSYVFGGALFAMPAQALMRRLGRRRGYTVAGLAAVSGSLLAWQAMEMHSLAMLCVATFVCGIYNAFGASLRFAAVDVADTYRPSFKPKAISLVLTGGIVGGILGPEAAKITRTWLHTEFAGTYLSLIAFAVVSVSLAQFIRLPDPRSAAVAEGPARSLREILAQPSCWVAVLCAALAYGIMNLLMVATPLAMQVCSLPFNDAAFVLEVHIIGMFLPGLFTGSLIARFGVLRIVFIGSLLMLVCVGIALSGVTLMHFTAALFLLGVGWNFMYTGGSTLLTQSYRPQEKNKIQGFMDAVVFGTMISTSASSGVLLFVNGWEIINLVSLPFVVLCLVTVGWLASRHGWRFGLAVAR